MPTVAFLIPPGVHLLDVAGPAQVFSNSLLPGDHPLLYLGESDLVTSHQGLPLRVEATWPRLPSSTLMVVPGRSSGDGPATSGLGAVALDLLRTHHEAGGRVASICSGAFALAEAGLLDGRRVTTHHELQDELARRYPATRVVRDVLFVRDGRIASSAGIASGIDLALDEVAAEHGPAVAARVARNMVVHARRDGSQPQAGVMLRHRDHLADVVHRAQDIIDARFTEVLPLPDLASSLGVSDRTLTRLFTRATGVTPLRYQQALRVERAGHLAARGWSLEAAARDVGFSDARMLRRLRNS